MKLTTTAGSAGSLRWMAPEQFAGEKATTASDIWTYAMTVLVSTAMYRIVSLVTHFQGNLHGQSTV